MISRYFLTNGLINTRKLILTMQALEDLKDAVYVLFFKANTIIR